MLIFGETSTLSKQEVEESFVNVLESSNYARDWLLKYTEKTHLAGTNYELVEWTAKKFTEYGLETSIKPYYVYLNFPKDHALHLLKEDTKIYSAPLKEDELPEDPATYGDNIIPTFHGYSANGNVTGQFFYANYGRKEDFEKLEELGVDLEGKIAIVRYGEIYRGLKVKFAQEHGCIGVLIYSDPGDDGEFIPANGYEQYPNGPARHESSVQRGSVLFLSYGPGDPTTPGYSSNSPEVERQNPYGTIPRIPSLPISYREVLPILSQLNQTGINSNEVDNTWVGKLPGFDYSIGPSPPVLKLNLLNEQFYNVTPIWNVFGEIKGIIENEVIIVGNHRDGWAGSAGDPNSGSAAILEIARAYNELSKKGWKPLRTIIFASFDGEEIGLVGSTEWAEDVSKTLQKNVVAYLNLDSAVTGNTLALSSSPVLNDLLLKTSKKLLYPKGDSLYEHFQNGPQKGKINILGSGSDYTVFLEHLGIPSFDIGFACNVQTDPIYQYHSNYDSFHWMDTYADPGFVYHNLMSRYLGLIILGLSNEEVINFKLSDYSSGIQSYFNSSLADIPAEWFNKRLNKEVSSSLCNEEASYLKKISNQYKSKTHHLLEKHSNWKLYLHGDNVTPPNEHKSIREGHSFDFAELVKITNHSINQFNKAAISFDRTAKLLQSEFDSPHNHSFWKRVKLYTKLKLVNLKLKYLERNFLYEEGLVERPWFKHIIFSSGRYTGYAGQSLPGLREAIEDNNFDDAVKWLNILRTALYRITLILTI